MRDRKMFLCVGVTHLSNITKAALAFCARMSFLIIVFYITVFFVIINMKTTVVRLLTQNEVLELVE